MPYQPNQICGSYLDYNPNKIEKKRLYETIGNMSTDLNVSNKETLIFTCGNTL